MKRVEVRNIETRLRSERPGDIEAPSWVRTRVIASMDGEQAERVAPAMGLRFLPFAVGTGVLAALAVGAALWVMPAQPKPVDENWQSHGTVKISLPDSISVPGLDALEKEAESVREDFVDLLGVIRVPVARLTEASKPFKGSV